MTLPVKTQTWTLKAENRVTYKQPGLVDVGNWREHDGVVHLLGEWEQETPWRDDPDGDVHYTTVRHFLTPCGIRLEPLEAGDPGGPVYVKDAITCVTCLATESDLA